MEQELLVALTTGASALVLLFFAGSLGIERLHARIDRVEARLREHQQWVTERLEQEGRLWLQQKRSNAALYAQIDELGETMRVFSERLRALEQRVLPERATRSIRPPRLFGSDDDDEVTVAAPLPALPSERED